MRGGLKGMGHGNRPIFLTEFGNIVHILADFRNSNAGGNGNFHIDRYLTDILK